MDKDRPGQSGIEYVEAEPIEGSGAPAPAATPFQPQMYSYYKKSDSCIPCCGPVGCSVLLLLGLVMIGDARLINGALYAIGIMLVISVISRLIRS